MKGVICCGGTGTRLNPLTKVVNKHLVAVGNKCMVQYPLETFTNAGIYDILVVSGGEQLGGFLNFLGSGRDFNCEITYRVQEEPKGIADAIRYAKGFTRGEPFVVILGDNFYEYNLQPYVQSFDYGAKCLLIQSERWKQHGVAVVKDRKIVDLVEKPKEFISPLVVTGVYMLDKACFNFIDSLKESQRGEYEIVDVLKQYMSVDALDYGELGGFWSDMGTFEGRKRVEDFLRSTGQA